MDLIHKEGCLNTNVCRGTCLSRSIRQPSIPSPKGIWESFEDFRIVSTYTRCVFVLLSTHTFGVYIFISPRLSLLYRQQALREAVIQ